jgi:2-succinyl-5-enolpyruvyl-6-hydroxy-3-cyclohexene-1-carboxylate synthase
MVDELHRHGVTMAVISPGSRSAALAIAFTEHPAIDTRVILDERSAAFYALGHARATDRPVVAVSTSGTAVANYLPAVVEADLSMVPLLVMTADRPPELRHVGSNQTIDQVGIFGTKARWFCDVGLAESERDSNAYWRTTISQGIARANGHGARPGPVHFNLSFREPTMPVDDDGRTRSTGYPFSIEGRQDGAPWQVDGVARPGAAPLAKIDGTRGVIVAGQGDFDRSALTAQARRLGWPILATALSRLRVAEAVTTYHHLLVDGVPESLTPEVVVTIGYIGPSSRLASLLDIGCPQIHLDRWGAWRDPYRRSTHVLEADPVASLATLDNVSDPSWGERWGIVEEDMRVALGERLGGAGHLSGPAIAASVGDSAASSLVVSSSMPVRDVDAYLKGRARVFANRGASGIDGFVSTALGIATAREATVALTGDLSFLHDAGGLVIDQLPDVVFVVVDNDGGGLFDLLPQASHAPDFERLFITPHGRDLLTLAGVHGMGAVEASSPGDLVDAINNGVSGGGAHMVRARVDREADLKTRRMLDDTARSIVGAL